MTSERYTSKLKKNDKSDDVYVVFDNMTDKSFGFYNLKEQAERIANELNNQAEKSHNDTNEV